MKDILAADIGGTNSRFAHFTAEGDGPLKLGETRWLGTREAASFGELIENLRGSGFSLKPEEADIAVVAVAGPVERGVYSSPPLIDWDVDFSNAGRDFGFRRSVLVNDFVAQAHACRSPVGEAAERVLPGNPDQDAAVAIIGAGTGLGKAALVPDGAGGFVAVPSEGGHANFPFASAREFEYREFLREELGDAYMTYNVVVSGRGLSLLHRFLTGEDLTPDEVTARFDGESETLRLAARFYARAARNYALETLASGGVYIAGGVAAKNPVLLKNEEFEREFRSSPTLAALLREIRVFLICDELSGLWGAALMGLKRLQRGG
jgi:glucokinase